MPARVQFAGRRLITPRGEMRSDWSDLPGTIREAVECRTGPIESTQPAGAGIHADIASTVHTPDGKIFVKASRKLPEEDGSAVRSLRREATLAALMSEFAPRLLWQAEAGGLALGFE
ncbi:hypothetical protein SMC26_44625 [Actinomadura fulvescens]|uniref:Uncharacterized protein n=1 Tax=Actinomadura fulvescens TaxID=46160 RepID=A0ABP6DDG9_9ACTN